MIQDLSILDKYKNKAIQHFPRDLRLFHGTSSSGSTQIQMLILDLPFRQLDSGLAHRLIDFQNFTQADRCLLAIHQLSLENCQLVAIQECAKNPINSNLQNAYSKEVSELLLSLLQTACAAEDCGFELDAFFHENITKWGKTWRLGSLSTLAHIVNVDSVSVSPLPAITSAIVQLCASRPVPLTEGAALIPSHLPFDDFRLFELLNDMYVGKITNPHVALERLKYSHKRVTSAAKKKQQRQQPSPSTDKKAQIDNEAASLLPRKVLLDSDCKDKKPTGTGSTQHLKSKLNQSQTATQVGGRLMLVTAALFMLLAVMVNQKHTLPPTAESNTRAPSRILGDDQIQPNLKGTCGSPFAPSSSWWAVVGPSDLLSLVRTSYCADAYSTREGIQVASFNNEREANAFATYLSEQTGAIFRVKESDQSASSKSDSPPAATPEASPQDERKSNAIRSCGSSVGSGDTWWPVLGPPNQLDVIKQSHCRDAYINLEGSLQVASFSTEADARAFSEHLTNSIGVNFRVGQPREFANDQ
jgi:hypothetical protein